MALPAPRQSHLYSRAGAAVAALLLRRPLRAVIVQGRERVCRDARLELLQLLGAGQVLEQVVLPLKLVVLLCQFLDLLLEDLHLLSDSIHQVVLDQILENKKTEKI